MTKKQFIEDNEKYLDAEIIRTRDLKILNELDLIVDVGNVYDP